MQHHGEPCGLPLFNLHGVTALIISAGIALTPAQSWAAPATEEDMALYSRLAAINVCIARSAGVGFDKAVAIAGETVAQQIQGQHDSLITVVGSEALNPEDLRRGAINSAVFGATELCPNQVPAEVLERARAALQNADPAVKSAELRAGSGD
jgi:hypothetical protein